MYGDNNAELRFEIQQKPFSYTYNSNLQPSHPSTLLNQTSNTLGRVNSTNTLEQQPQHSKLTGTKQCKPHHDGVRGGLNKAVHNSQRHIRPSQLRLCSHEACRQGSRRSTSIQCQAQRHSVESGWSFVEMVVVVGYGVLQYRFVSTIGRENSPFHLI
jgi:hypothetical protein